MNCEQGRSKYVMSLGLHIVCTTGLIPKMLNKLSRRASVGGLPDMVQHRLQSSQCLEFQDETSEFDAFYSTNQEIFPLGQSGSVSYLMVGFHVGHVSDSVTRNRVRFQFFFICPSFCERNSVICFLAPGPRTL